MGKKNRFKNMLIRSVFIAVTVTIRTIWFSPVADSSGQSQCHHSRESKAIRAQTCHTMLFNPDLVQP